MSERKVLNKYYPPDYDPAKIPRLKRPKIRQFAIRVMAPFNMRCDTCGEYIYKGKKFNSRQETVENQDYLGLRIYRFYIKCPTCVSEITFLTDPENCDYSIEGGASRNFEAAKTAMKLALEAQKEIEDEEANNPMKVLENRTKSSRQEMDMLETLQELKELNSAHARLNENDVIELHTRYKQQLEVLQDQEDEKLILDIFTSKENDSVKRLPDELDDDLADLLNPDLNTKVSRLSQVEHSKGDDAMSKAFNAAPSTSSTVKRKSLLSNIVKKKEPKVESNNAVSSMGPPLTSTSIMPGLYSKLAPVRKAAPSRSGSSSTATTGSSTTSSATTGSCTTGSSTTSSSSAATTSAPGVSGLGLLGGYSDTSSDSSSP